MWARAVEIALACWLALSPFIFGHPDEAAFLWYNDFACALAIHRAGAPATGLPELHRPGRRAVRVCCYSDADYASAVVVAGLLHPTRFAGWLESVSIASLQRKVQLD